MRKESTFFGVLTYKRRRNDADIPKRQLLKLSRDLLKFSTYSRRARGYSTRCRPFDAENSTPMFNAEDSTPRFHADDSTPMFNTDDSLPMTRLLLLAVENLAR